MPEVAQATITVTPVLKGAQQALTNDMTAAAGVAGAQSGAVAGASMTAAMGTKMTKAGGALTKGLTVPLMAVGAASVAAWKDVDTGLDTIVQKTGASGNALDEMGGILNSIATTIPTDFATAGAAIGEVNTRFQVTGSELETLSTQFIKFADINNQDVSTSVDSVSSMLAAFGLSAEDASGMLDALTAVSQKTGVDVGQLANLTAANAAQFQEMGLSAEEAAAFIGSASMAGLDASTAMMGLKTAMKNATKDGISLDDALSGFTATMQSDASEADKLAAAYELFGTRGGAAIENAVANGTLSLDDFSLTIGEFEGTVSTSFENTKGPMDDFQTTLNELKIAGSEIVTAAGPALADILSTIADVVSKAAEAWGELSPEMQDTILKIALVAAAAGPLLSIGGKIIGGISTITGGLGNLIGSIGGVGGAASSAAGPVAGAAGSFGTFAGQALQMIAAAAALLVAAFAIKILVGAAIEIAAAGWPAIAVLGGMIVAIGGLMAVAAACGPALTAGAVGIGVFGAAVLAIGGGIALATAGISTLVNAVSNLITVISSNAPGIISIVTAIGNSVDGTITTIAEGIATIIDSISGGLQGVLDSVAGIFDSIGNAALNAGTGFEKLASAVIRLTNETGIADLASTMTTVATGVTSVNTAATGAGNAATGINNLAKAMTQLATGAAASAKGMEAFGSTSKSAISQIGNAIQGAQLAQNMSNAMDNTIRAARAGISALQSMFYGTRFSFNQHIAVPHFSLSGSFNAEKGTVPTVQTKWYAKAAEYGAIFSKPALIGVGDASQPELLIGTDTLENLVGGRGVTNYITVNGAENPEQWANRFARQMKLEMRMA